MIPIDPTKPLRKPDEKSGVTYLFRVLTDEMQDDYDKAIALSQKAKVAETPAERNRLYAEHQSALINLFLVGWENCETEFPNDGNPARLFPGTRRGKMLNFMNSVFPDLLGIDEDDIKN